MSVGIDIEHMENFPNINQNEERRFFKDNFSDSELKYARKKKNGTMTLLGLFTAKEAIIKTDNSLRLKLFKNIIIKHDQNGKPLFDGFEISISHSQNICVAVAVKLIDK